MDRARAAKRHATAELSAGHAEHVAQNPEQWRVLVDVYGTRSAIYGDCIGHLSLLMSLPPSNRATTTRLRRAPFHGCLLASAACRSGMMLMVSLVRILNVSGARHVATSVTVHQQTTEGALLLHQPCPRMGQAACRLGHGDERRARA